jgi:cytoplasmic tRNA 2-thiolation protein 2
MMKTYFREQSDKDLQHKGTKHPRHKTRVWNKIRACYVEVCGGFPDMKDRTEDVRKMASRYDEVEFIPLRLENAFDTAWWSNVGGEHNDKTLHVGLNN